MMLTALKRTSLYALLLLTSTLGAIEPLQEIDREKISEALGHLIVRQLKNPGFEFNLDKIVQGMQDERSGKPSPMSEEEYEQTIYTIQENLFLQTAEKNLAQAVAFLHINSETPGVTKLDEKLQYKITQSGVGEEVGPESIPLIHYKGSLIDGTVFANSQERNEPLSLPMQQTISGFSKGLIGMKEGEKRTLYIHPELAHGISGQLPPNSLLIFEVEVVKANSLNTQDIANR